MTTHLLIYTRKVQSCCKLRVESASPALTVKQIRKSPKNVVATIAYFMVGYVPADTYIGIIEYVDYECDIVYCQ